VTVELPGLRHVPLALDLLAALIYWRSVVRSSAAGPDYLATHILGRPAKRRPSVSDSPPWLPGAHCE
jgi:hypothetical protein